MSGFRRVLFRSSSPTCLNPLHCGAVVASQWRRGAAAPRPTRAQPRCAPIIIPFIAGQWSLRAGSSKYWANAMRFNPLHCGAVVASDRIAQGGRGAGRGFNPLHYGAVVASRRRNEIVKSIPPVSIPFIAGQWSLLPRGGSELNARILSFQSPSLRGSGRFLS